MAHVRRLRPIEGGGGERELAWARLSGDEQECVLCWEANVAGTISQ